jgi:hypothetical protein
LLGELFSLALQIHTEALTTYVVRNWLIAMVHFIHQMLLILLDGQTDFH